MNKKTAVVGTYLWDGQGRVKNVPIGEGQDRSSSISRAAAMADFQRTDGTYAPVKQVLDTSGDGLLPNQLSLRQGERGFVLDYTQKNNRCAELAELYEKSAVHQQCVDITSSLVAGTGRFNFSTLDNKPLTDKRQADAEAYLTSIGWETQYSDIVFDMNLYGSSAFYMVETLQGNTTRLSQVIHKDRRTFRLGVPTYADYQWQTTYHVYNRRGKWQNNLRGIITLSDWIGVRNYNGNNEKHKDKYVVVPAWRNNKAERGTNPVHSYLLQLKERKTNHHYSPAYYENRQIWLDADTLYENSRFDNSFVKDGFKSQYIVLVYSEDFAASTDAEKMTEKVNAEIRDIKEWMKEENGTRVIPMPLVNQAGKIVEGYIEVVPIPAPQNTPEYRKQSIENATANVLVSHRISVSELIGLARASNSLANQKDYLTAGLAIMNTFNVRTKREVIERFMTDVLFSKENGFGNVKVKVENLPNELIFAMFLEYLSVEEIRMLVLGLSNLPPEELAKVEQAANRRIINAAQAA